MKTTLSLLAASCLVVPVSAQELQPGTELVDLFKMSQLEGATEDDLRRMLENNAAFEIQLPELKEFRGDLREDASHPQTWFIGLGVEPLPPFVREHLGLEKDAGVRVIQVAPASPAARAGIQPDDIVFKAGGKNISSLESLKAEVELAGREDKPLRLEWLRQGHRKDAEIRPESLPGPEGPRPQRDVPPAWQETPMPIQPDPLRSEPPEQGAFLGGEQFRGPDGELKPEWRKHFQEMAERSPKVASPWAIGVLVEPLDPMTRDHFELPDGTGVRVEAIVTGSPAAETELKVNDIIVAANGRKISSLDDLKNVVEIAGRGRNAVKLEVIHRGSRKVVEVMPRGPEPLEEPGTKGAPGPAMFPMIEIQRRLDAQQKEIEILRREVRELRSRLDQE